MCFVCGGWVCYLFVGVWRRGYGLFVLGCVCYCWGL